MMAARKSKVLQIRIVGVMCYLPLFRECFWCFSTQHQATYIADYASKCPKKEEWFFHVERKNHFFQDPWHLSFIS